MQTEIKQQIKWVNEHLWNKHIQIHAYKKKKKKRSKEIFLLYWCPELGSNGVSANVVSCHSWKWLATVILSSASFSFCQIGKRVGTSSELEWWLMTHLFWCTLPCWRTATLFSTNWATLQTPLPVFVGSETEQTTHSEKCVRYTVLITAHKPPSMSATLSGPV